MESKRQGGVWVRQARLRAGLTQQDLAERLATSQSLIARWENGQVEPGFSSVVEAVRACGFDLAVNVMAFDQDHDILIKDNLKLSPEERLRKMHASRRGADRLRAAASKKSAP